MDEITTLQKGNGNMKEKERKKERKKKERKEEGKQVIMKEKKK